jgi:hypothetical protein
VGELQLKFTETKLKTVAWRNYSIADSAPLVVTSYETVVMTRSTAKAALAAAATTLSLLDGGYELQATYFSLSQSIITLRELLSPSTASQIFYTSTSHQAPRQHHTAPQRTKTAPHNTTM